VGAKIFVGLGENLRRNKKQLIIIKNGRKEANKSAWKSQGTKRNTARAIPREGFSRGEAELRKLLKESGGSLSGRGKERPNCRPYSGQLLGLCTGVRTREGGIGQTPEEWGKGIPEGRKTLKYESLS